MATIVTVHGTFASGEETGAKWWQRGSALESEIRELVTSDDGVIEWKPHIWSGHNSEMARREAGRELAWELQKVAAHGPTVLVGHSHGGSVINNALVQIAGRKDRSWDEKISGWITVGTPFLRFRSSNLSHSFSVARTTLPRALFVAPILAFSFVIMPASVVLNIASAIAKRFGFTSIGHGEQLFSARLIQGLPMTLGDLLFLVIVGLLVLMTVAWSISQFFDLAGLARLQRGKHVIDQTFGPKWRCFWHRSDEALGSLTQAVRADVKLFKSITDQLAIVVLALPCAIAVFYFYFWLGDTLQLCNNQGLLAQLGWCGVAQGLSATGNWLFAYLKDTSVMWLASQAFDLVQYGLSMVIAAPLATGLTWFLALLCLPVVINGIDWIWVSLLNRLTNSRIKSAAFGSDVPGESVTGVQSYPGWSSTRFPALPKELAAEISAWSDVAAYRALPEIREALVRAGVAYDGGGALDVLLKSLTWDELIHTSYFNVPRFQKLLAYAITQCPGFRATAKFMADPDFRLVANWYAQMQAVPVRQ